MSKKFMPIVCLILALNGECFSRPARDEPQEEWLLEEQKKQYNFIKNFSTRQYMCERKRSVKFIFDIAKKTWRTEIGEKEPYWEPERYTVFKSDDIREGISLCGTSDMPESSDRYLNKHFCIVKKKSRGETHYKCLLEIEEDFSNKVLSHTLVCGDGGFKFNLTYGKIFHNNFSIGPYSGYENTLQQSMYVSDCVRFGP